VLSVLQGQGVPCLEMKQEMRYKKELLASDFCFSCKITTIISQILSFQKNVLPLHRFWGTKKLDR